MKEGLRSGGSSEVVVKNRNSSGCLVVRRKGDSFSGGNGSSDSRKVYASKEKKRRRVVTSDPDSSDEIVATPHRRMGPETIRLCNDLTVSARSDEEQRDLGRKRERLDEIRRNGLDGSENKRTQMDVFDFNEYESGFDFRGRKFSGPMHIERIGIDREFEAGSSGGHGIDKRKSSYFERPGTVNHAGKSRFDDNREGSLRRDKFLDNNSDQAIRLQGKNGVLKVLVNKKKGRDGSLEKYKLHKVEQQPVKEAHRVTDTAKRDVAAPFYPEDKVPRKTASAGRPEKKKHVNTRKSLPMKNSKSSNWDSDVSDTSLKPEPESAVRSAKRVKVEREDPPSEKITPEKKKDVNVKRGSGTEKQKLRERIRGILIDAGWTIDYRPRRNRDYLDAVYINPSGTAYWSIIKAYDAFQKRVNEDDEAKPSTDGSTPRLVADEDLSQLTRKTRKKMEKERKMMQNSGFGFRDEKQRCSSKQSAKSFKSRTDENGVSSGQNLKDVGEGPSSGSNSHGRKSRKDGRCTLLVRGSNKGQNSEPDGFVPYTGKRTILAWLIDSGSVHLRQKVLYKNRRRSRVMLEGWVTRDGIHCGCCSKILTVSKFEIHAGSKLRQPYQNIFLDSGVSLMQCQVDAWNKQEGSEHFDFHSVGVDGDDPNDDTCSICGDGGDLICCDGCPSTFHLSCLDIEELPPGDWHCPNCTCKFCGIAIETLDEEDDSATLSCSLCEKKYHESCVQDIDANSVDSSATDPPFCGQKCKELSERLQKYVGIKHDLESGFSWSLIRRTDEDSNFSQRGIPHRVECNSKLAVGMTVMDECFLPIIDTRSGINLIRNVLYNCGSNFTRLNFTSFYTAILERGDEIICAASLRFHGTKLAEMPFIGTRHIFRRQGMCRRLFNVIESALCSLKVEKLIIPAITDLIHTWTDVFGFTPVEESLKHDIRSMSLLAFPGIHMLQKVLGDQENGANIATEKDPDKMECDDGKCSEPELEVKPDIKVSVGNDTVLNLANETTEQVVAKVKSDSQVSDLKNDVSDVDVSTSVKPEIYSNHSDLNCANETMEKVSDVAESIPLGADVKIEAVVCDNNVAATVKLEIDSPSRSGGPQGFKVTDLNLGNVSTLEDFVGDLGLEDVNMSDERAFVSGAEVSGTEVPTNDPLPGSFLENVVVTSVTPEITPISECVSHGTVCSGSDSHGDKFSEMTSDLKNILPSKPSCDEDTLLTSGSLNVSLEIENPGPCYNRTETLETVALPKMIHVSNDSVTENKSLPEDEALATSVLSNVSSEIENPGPFNCGTKKLGTNSPLEIIHHDEYMTVNKSLPVDDDAHVMSVPLNVSSEIKSLGAFNSGTEILGATLPSEMIPRDEVMTENESLLEDDALETSAPLNVSQEIENSGPFKNGAKILGTKSPSKAIHVSDDVATENKTLLEDDALATSGLSDVLQETENLGPFNNGPKILETVSSSKMVRVNNDVITETESVLEDALETSVSSEIKTLGPFNNGAKIMVTESPLKTIPGDDDVAKNEFVLEEAIVTGVSTEIENPGAFNNGTEILETTSPSKMVHGNDDDSVTENLSGPGDSRERSVSSDIENPGHFNDGTEILETVSPSKTNHGGGGDDDVVTKTLVHDSIVEAKPESSS